MSNAPIGVIDSGVGGLTILKEIQRQLPDESLIYIGDTANCPYGGRTADDIYRLSANLIHRLQTMDAKLVVIACNTISVTCIGQLRAAFPGLPIVGTVPAVKTAVKISRSRRIGILSTVVTAESDFQSALIRAFASECKVVNLGTNELVPRIERAAWSTELPEILPRLLEPFRNAEIDALVLGCSHYPLLKEEIRAVLGPDVALVDSAEGIARQVRRVLSEHGLLAGQHAPAHRFITTAHSPALGHVLQRLDIRTEAAVPVSSPAPAL
jgi:glutamate racemase